jgi:Spy/CpxP family protein refolding chaperone
MVKPAGMQVYALLCAVLLLGSVIGAGATYAYLRRPAEITATQDSPRVRREKIDALSKELDLNDAQRAKVEGILEASQQERMRRMRVMHETCGEPVREHKKRVDGEIRAVLTPEQQKRFDVLAEKQDRKYFPKSDASAAPSSEPGEKR